jgi:hypothetical protein
LAAAGLASSFLAGAVWAATESANTDATIAINAFMGFPLLSKFALFHGAVYLTPCPEIQLIFLAKSNDLLADRL